jgi:shikimate kinase / 3-dehydroquinate synthase
MRRNIYLTGFMGSGKTTIGRELARLFHRDFVDMDDALTKRFKMPITRVFSEKGEDRFRKEESALLKRIAEKEGKIVATGGGIVVRKDNRDLMRESGRLVYLETTLDACRERLGDNEINARPNWRDLESVRTLFERRLPLYEEAEYPVSVDGLSPEKIAEAIATRLFPDERFTVHLGEAECPVLCTWDTPKALAALARGRKSALITDRNVDRLHGERYRRALTPDLALVLRPGEGSKTLTGAKSIYQQLLNNHYDRGHLLVAIGGGMVTDLGAFAASTYKRGMNFMIVSTTLLGCVDAAVGGKAAVNLGQAKNAVGCFTVPEAVVLDALALRTLSRRHIREGLVEAYKTGLIIDPALAVLIETHLSAMMAGDLPLINAAARMSAKAKAEVVGMDFTESGRRAILNFGHTYGHAVEGWHRYKISHGSAVAMGMIVAIKLSAARGLLAGGLSERLLKTVNALRERRVEWPPLEDAWEIMRHDKKIREGRMVFVLLEDIGQPALVHDVTYQELAAVLDKI